MSGKKITISDIAKALGISKTTVSRAISGKGRIGSGTKDRVMDYVEKNNYEPNMMAKALAGQRYSERQHTHNLAVVWPDDYSAMEIPFFQKLIVGIAEIAANYGYDVMLTMAANDNITGLKRIIENHKVDGAILTRTLVDDVALVYLKERGVPFVVVGSTGYQDILWVDNDNYDACVELIEYILGKGLKRLALIGGSKNHIITRTRFKAFKDAHEKHDIKIDEGLVYLDIENTQKLDDAIKDILSKDVEGIICMDDGFVGEVLTKCAEAGVRIPEDIKIASFYDSTFLENSRPPVTALRFNDRNLGAVTASSLIRSIEGETVPSQRLKNHEIMLRKSTETE
ncbi:LacI family DNA-binding transcriptional regulator [Butyrivibrio sp. INlla21]|uniref:LacI family DNA-binding transcriptional regulator n=1 Tax=Butyrivibrio sp. INlla21 TaxID=1520811 RepID=UPI0008E103B2|nr:LacI family DNA-binding transcriptional regulator [Butyrivibrio sp. INlla21]SFU31330.1 DNA-binding transcriptional regulator, LacI/PurR family [Butyrivibrio sp. INlla21]